MSKAVDVEITAELMFGTSRFPLNAAVTPSGSS
jgi:hypothetical protein